ncbi:MAG: hypothetical protein KJ053_09995 [Dehalococcoidia bacterium]|nr:hypothetical protein [Dehalococcoidia bacterium]
MATDLRDPEDLLVARAKEFVKRGTRSLTSLDGELEFMETASQLLGGLRSISSKLTKKEGERMLQLIADGMFDILGDPRIDQVPRVQLVKVSCAAIEFAASQGIYARILPAFWDLAIGAIPGGSPTKDIHGDVVAELTKLSSSRFAEARLSAEVGLERLG